MFDVQINLDIQGKDKQGSFVRMIQLPFPPFNGLKISWPYTTADGEDEECDVTVLKVEWDLSMKLFVVECLGWGVKHWCNCVPSDDCCTFASQARLWASPEAGFAILEEPYPIYRHELPNESYDRGVGWPPLGGEGVPETETLDNPAASGQNSQ